jgi:hypothetical protein
MKETLGILLVGALSLSAILNIWYAWDHFTSVRELQALYTRQVTINNARAAANSLANEAIEYSKGNPAVDAILYKFDLKARPGAALTNQSPIKAN